MATLNCYNVNDIIKSYSKSRDNFFKSQDKPKVKKYNSLTELLEICPLLGATKYGNNFIA
ncbi:MAG: hypothetical protein PHV68_05515 [Candidatus Gastranaerophilales bacterium]|nr:hypothetical protein [Candidatus Gastranaerophilales bacterium]